MKLVDLHTHSTASDGTDTPEALVKKAEEQGLGALALTDHDTLKGLAEAEEAAAGTGLEFIRGCELSLSSSEGEIHMLALWLPHQCDTLKGFLENMRDRRKQRNLQIVERLRKAGVDITLEEVEARAKSSVGRPHIAAVLVDKGYVKTYADAFQEWLGAGGKAYVPKVAPRPEQAVRILRELGASPVLAHPRLRKPSPEWLEGFVRDLKPIGLCGLEAWHSEQTPADEAQIQALAAKYDLGLTGGSDYHGCAKPNIQLGTGKNNLSIGMDVLEKFKARRKAAGLPC